MFKTHILFTFPAKLFGQSMKFNGCKEGSSTSNIRQHYKSCGIYLIEARLLQLKDHPNNEEFQRRNIYEVVMAFTPSAADFQISGNTIIPTQDRIVKLEFYGASNGVLAAQNSGMTYPVELVERPPEFIENGTNGIGLLLQPVSPREIICKLCERFPGNSKVQSGQTPSEFDALVAKLVPANLSPVRFVKYVKIIKYLFEHENIVTLLGLLANECPFLWHSFNHLELEILAKLSNLVPIAIQNYLEHIYRFWKNEILCRDIEGTIDTLSGKSVKQISGAFPLISSKDRDKISRVLKKQKASRLLTCRLCNSSQRILTLRTFIKELRFLNSLTSLISRLKAHSDKNFEEGSIIFAGDAIILAPCISGCAEPIRVILDVKDRKDPKRRPCHKPQPRQYALCMLWAMKNVTRKKSSMSMRKAVREFVDIAIGEQLGGSAEPPACPTEFRWITAPKAEIWREIENLSDYFDLDYLIRVYDKLRSGNIEIKEDILAPLLVWDFIRRFYTKPGEIGSDQAASLRSKNELHFSQDKAGTIETTSETDIISDQSVSLPGLSSGTSSDSRPSSQPPTPSFLPSMRPSKLTGLKELKVRENMPIPQLEILQI